MTTCRKLLLFVPLSALLYLPASGRPTAGPSDFRLRPGLEEVKLLNQKLEYRVQEDSSIQIGNLLIAPNSIKLTVNNDGSATFVGPYQFMVGGTLLLKDPHGQALWTRSDLSNDDVEKSTLTQSKILRNEIARFRLKNFSNLEDKLSKNAFFSFCIFNETEKNRIQLCAPKYSLVRKKDKSNLTTLESKLQENEIIVNGTEVTEHGIIQFDKNINIASLAVSTLNGTTLDLRTEAIPVEILDIVSGMENSKVRLTIREKNKLRKRAIPWTSEISLAQSFFYIEAFGQAPLRQELSLDKESLPTDADRPTLLQGFPKTYSESTQVTFKESSKIKMTPKTPGDDVDDKTGNTEWTLRNITMGLNKPHLVTVSSRQKNFEGMLELERAPSWDITLSGAAGNFTYKQAKITDRDSSSGLQINIQKYFDSFLGLSGPLNYMHWGLQLETAQRKLKEAESQISHHEVDLSYRLSSGFHHTEPSTSLRLSLRNDSSSASAHSQWLGLKITHEGLHEAGTILLGDGHEAMLAYYGLCLSDDCKNGTMQTIYWQSRYSFTEQAFWHWKIQGELTTLKKDEGSISQTYSELQLGLGFQF